MAAHPRLGDGGVTPCHWCPFAGCGDCDAQGGGEVQTVLDFNAPPPPPTPHL